MAKRKAPKRPVLHNPPKTSSPLLLAYVIMREAEACEQKDYLRAMDLHTWIMDLADEHYSVREAVHNLGIRERIGKNQIRLNLDDLRSAAFAPKARSNGGKE